MHRRCGTDWEVTLINLIPEYCLTFLYELSIIRFVYQYAQVSDSFRGSQLREFTDHDMTLVRLGEGQSTPCLTAEGARMPHGYLTAIARSFNLSNYKLAKLGQSPIDAVPTQFPPTIVVDSLPKNCRYSDLSDISLIPRRRYYTSIPLPIRNPILVANQDVDHVQ